MTLSPFALLRTGLLAVLATTAIEPTALAAEAHGPDTCPQPLRIAVLDFDETPRKPDGIGMTALQTAVAQRIGDRSALSVVIRAYPYARALRSFRDGEAEAILVAEGAGRRAVPEATRVPMMRLLFVRVGVEGRARSPLAGDLGTLNGLVPPPGAIRAGEQVQTVVNYDALLRQLIGGRVNRILGARPSIDVFLADHPKTRDRLGPMEQVAEQAMTLHLLPRLAPDCAAYLAAVATQVAADDLPGVFRRAAPTIDPTPFLLMPEPRPRGEREP